MYVIIDYVLRDLLAVPVLSSCWDECLMLLALGCVVYERLGRETPLQTGCNPLDLPVCIFLTVCFVLMNVVTPYYSIQISGFRATVQYMLWFFLVTRLVHDDRDFMRVYLALVVLATVIALHGVYQYIVAVPIPASWMTHTETAVRTRVYSIFGSPNIMGDFMTMFAPMAAGLAYCTKKPEAADRCVDLRALHVLRLPVHDVARLVGRDGDRRRDLRPAGRPAAARAAAGRSLRGLHAAVRAQPYRLFVHG